MDATGVWPLRRRHQRAHLLGLQSDLARRVLTITAVRRSAPFSSPRGVWRYVFSLIFIWFSVWAAILSFSIGKWIPTVGAWGAHLCVGLLHADGHHLRDPARRTWLRRRRLRTLLRSLHRRGAGALLQLRRLRVAQRRRRRDEGPPERCAVYSGALGCRSVLLYGLPILAILFVLPQSQVTGLSGFIDAIKAVFSVYGGHVATDGTATLTGAGQVFGDLAALCFIWALVSSGTTWIMGADRAMAVAAYDGAGPRILGRSHRGLARQSPSICSRALSQRS